MAFIIELKPYLSMDYVDIFGIFIEPGGYIGKYYPDSKAGKKK